MPLSQLRDPTNRTDGTRGKPGYDGGHLAGLQLGGHDLSENVVPMFKAFNRGPYGNLEATLRKRVADISARGNIAELTVECTYASAQDDTPVSFEITLRSGPNLRSFPTLESTTTLSQPADIAVTPEPDRDRAALLTANDPRVGARASMSIAPAPEFNLGPHRDLATFVRETGHLPSSRGGWYPDHPALRPYEYLDLLAFASPLPEELSSEPFPLGRGEFGSFRSFSDTQRKAIFQANLAKNGYLKSDDPDDPHQRLDERGTLDFPEVDHIVPLSSGGTSMYSNARLVSWELNNSLDRIKDVSELIDVTSRALPTVSDLGETGLGIVVDCYLTREKQDGEFTIKDLLAWGVSNFSIFTGRRLTARHKELVAKRLDHYKTRAKVAKTGKDKFLSKIKKRREEMFEALRRN